MLLFRMGTTTYAVDVTDAQEIIPFRPSTRLPGAPPYVRGLINVRGTIVTVVDLGLRLDATRTPVTDGSVLLVPHRNGLVGVLVEEVADVRPLDVDDTVVPASPNAIVRGVARVDDDPVLVLDLRTLVKQVLLS